MHAEWKPLPGAPTYEINPLGWVRNKRSKAILTKGTGRTLTTGSGKNTYFSRHRLVELAKTVHATWSVHLGSFPGLARPALPPSEAAEEVMSMEGRPRVDDRPEKARQAPPRHQERSTPTRTLPLRDPWASGAIESRSPWDWAGIR